MLAILRKKGASFDNVLLSVPVDDFFEKIDLVSIPAVLVFGRDGRLKKRFDNETNEYGEGGFTYREHIIPLVEQALADGR